MEVLIIHKSLCYLLSLKPEFKELTKDRNTAEEVPR